MSAFPGKPLLCLAPMATLSHRALRELVAGFGGCGLYWTEMVSAAAFVSGAPFERYYADALPDPSKVVFQVVGSDPERIERTARLLAERGGAGIDLNMGCAAPEIVRQGAGVAWMRDAAAAARLVARLRAALPGMRLSCKIRAGHGGDALAERLLGFCRALVGAGADSIAVHPRLAEEKFKRPPMMELAGMLARELPVPVVANGDIAGAADARVALEAGCAGAMIGRAALRKPWIFAEIASALGAAAPAQARPVDLLEVSSRFLDLLARHQPPEFHLSRARRFFFYFTENLRFGHGPRHAIQNAPSLAAIERILADYFIQSPEERTVTANW